jgi:hypothetical protein
MQQVPQLTALHSLRHLQLYKTVPPLLEDMQKLGQLTQLTSLLLADQSYMPGHEAMVLVDLSPLSSLTRLESLCVAGICPRRPPAASAYMSADSAYMSGDLCRSLVPGWDAGVAHALVAAAAAKRSSSSSSSSSSGSRDVASLPSSLTSVVIKRVDDLALELWSYHLLLQAPLRKLHVYEYLEPHSRRWFDADPAPLLARLAPHLPELSNVSFGIADSENPRAMHGYQARAAETPCNITNLQQLQSLDLTHCQLSVQNPEGWVALASLTRLTSLYGIDAWCAPPPDLQLPSVKTLGIENAYCWTHAGFINLQHVAPGVAAELQLQTGIAVGASDVWHLTATFPQLNDLCLAVDNFAQWLGVQQALAEATGLEALALIFRYRIGEVCAGAFERLGSQLPALRSLSVWYSGGPDMWRLLPLQQYTQVEHLALHCMNQAANPMDQEDADYYDAS